MATVVISVALMPLPASAAAGQSGGSAVTVTVDARHPGGQINQGLIGTNQPVAGASTLMSRLGVHWARTDFSFESAYNCATGVWNPQEVDTRVTQDLAMGGTPEMLVSYAPPCMTTNPLHETLDPPDLNNYAAWKALVEQAAYHEMTQNGVHIFEVWNEPDGTFWHGTILDYLSMYKATASAIEAAAARAGRPDVLIGGPALLFPDPAWVEPFLAFVALHGLPLGFISWHYYGDYPALGPLSTPLGVLPPQIPGVGPYWYNPLTMAQTFADGVRLVRSEIAGFPQLHPLTVLDEWNIDAGYDPRANGAYDAAFAAAVLEACQSAGLDRMAFFRIADDSPATLGNWGMLYSNLTPKPVYWTFDFWHSMMGRRLPTTEDPKYSANPFAGQIGSLASQGSNRTRQVMLYNFVPYDLTGQYGTVDPNPYEHPVTIKWKGLPPGDWHYTVRMIDAGHAGSLIASGESTDGRVQIDMAGESVALVQLSQH